MNNQPDRHLNTYLSTRFCNTQHLSGILRLLVIISILLVSLPISLFVSRSSILMGAYISGVLHDPKKVNEFARLVGASPDIVMWYQDWAHADVKNFKPDLMNAVIARGAIPLVTWEPWDYTRGLSQPAYALRTIIAGNHDPYIRQWARDAQKWGKQMYLRFAHEMNGDWYPWSPNINGNTSAEYVTAWQHIVQIFREEGATNVQWVWSPQAIFYEGSIPFTDLYPGEAYVDWIGLDGYNQGVDLSDQWLSFAQIFANSYKIVETMTDKPIMIAETASAEAGGNKADWIRQGLLNDLPTKFPRIRAVIWFNENKETDWRVDSSIPALAAYKEVLATFQ